MTKMKTIKSKISGIFLVVVFYFFTLVQFASAEIKKATVGEGKGTGWDPNTLNVFTLPSGSIYYIIEKTLFWLLGIFGFIGIVGFVISGIMYLTAAGNDDQIKLAKKAMTASIYGVIIGLSGLVVISAVDNALTGDETLF